MNIVYMDNFRGFSDSLIEFSNATFCVGENSSGKTSFLSLIRLFTNKNFWVDDFASTAEAEYNSYDDVASVHGTNQECFYVGGGSSIKVKGDVEDFRFALFKYINDSGSPSISDCSFYFKGIFLHIKYRDKGKVGFKIKEEKRNFDAGKVGVSSLITIIKKEQALKVGTQYNYNSFKHANQSKVFGENSRLPVFMILSFALATYFKNNPEKVEGSDKNKVQSEFFNYFAFGNLLQFADSKWIAPIRTKAKRTYDERLSSYSPDGEHIPYSLSRIFSSKDKDTDEFISAIETFGISSGLFSTIKSHNLSEKKDGPFELEISLDSKSTLNLCNVGYGVSQVLPIFVEMYSNDKRSSYLIQQPEVHLHPKAQAALGDYLFFICLRDHKKFVIETHSDFLIDRYRKALKNSNKKIQSRIIYFEHKDGRNIAHEIPIASNGSLPDEQPEGYRSFFVNESFDTFDI